MMNIMTPQFSRAAALVALPAALLAGCATTPMHSEDKSFYMNTPVTVGDVSFNQFESLAACNERLFGPGKNCYVTALFSAEKGKSDVDIYNTASSLGYGIEPVEEICNYPDYGESLAYSLSENALTSENLPYTVVQKVGPLLRQACEQLEKNGSIDYGSFSF